MSTQPHDNPPTNASTDELRDTIRLLVKQREEFRGMYLQAIELAGGKPGTIPAAKALPPREIAQGFKRYMEMQARTGNNFPAPGATWAYAADWTMRVTGIAFGASPLPPDDQARQLVETYADAMKPAIQHIARHIAYNGNTEVADSSSDELATLFKHYLEEAVHSARLGGVTIGMQEAIKRMQATKA